MSTVPEHESRRYLIAIGAPYCPNMGLSDLTRVASDIEQIDIAFPILVRCEA
jgi:hypothetical protein